MTSIHVSIVTNAAGPGAFCSGPGITCTSAATNRVGAWVDGVQVSDSEVCQAHTLAICTSVRAHEGATVTLNGRPATMGA